MKAAIVSIMLLMSLAACTKIDYIGESYPPTNNVDLYFSEADLRMEYKVMGQVIASASDYVSAGKMQNKIMEEARKKGADAVVILGMERYHAGESQTYQETTETKEKSGGTTSTTTATTKNEVQKEKEIKALFIKYR